MINKYVMSETRATSMKRWFIAVSILALVAIFWCYQLAQHEDKQDSEITRICLTTDANNCIEEL